MQTATAQQKAHPCHPEQTFVRISKDVQWQMQYMITPCTYKDIHVSYFYMQVIFTDIDIHASYFY